jgi:hypothetical protein
VRSKAHELVNLAVISLLTPQSWLTAHAPTLTCDNVFEFMSISLSGCSIEHPVQSGTRKINKNGIRKDWLPGQTL